MPSANAAKIIAVVGPTGSGKSALALALAQRLGGEILNTDSLQVYRGLDIGTAKPTAQERALVPHHLLNRVTPDEIYSAGTYAREAGVVLDRLAAQGRPAILCGGTGLYFRALLEGLAHIPPVSDQAKAQAQALLQAEGAPGLHRQLAQMDPPGAARLHPHDTARLLRALEVLYTTGKPLWTFYVEAATPGRPEPVLQLGLDWERAVLYQRINQRVEAMLAAGWVEEVQGLLAQGYSPNLKPLQAIGYREICQMLAGQMAPQALAPAIMQRTRHYAKRQLTWFRANPAIVWAPPLAQDLLLAQAEAFIAK